MNQGRTVFAQLKSLVPHKAFARCVERYRGNHRFRSFSCWDQFLSMAFAQLTYRESLRDIKVCLGAMPEKLYHMGIRGRVVRSTLADANEKRDWRIFAEFAQVLIRVGAPGGPASIPTRIRRRELKRSPEPQMRSSALEGSAARDDLIRRLRRELEQATHGHAFVSSTAAYVAWESW